MTRVARIFFLLTLLWVPVHPVTAQDSEPQSQQRESQEPQRRRDFFSRWWRGSAQYQKTHDDVKSAYRKPAQKAVASTASVLVEDKSVALATVVDKDGYLVTKASLLPSDGKLFCKLPGNDSVEASVVGQDEEYDLALLKVEGLELTPARWRSDQATMGTFVAAIDPDGNVLGLGVVSTDPRAIRGQRNPTPRRAWLGVSLGTGTDGTMISNVQDRTAASRAGLEVGDLIKAIDGAEMKSTDQIIATIGRHNPGDEIKLLVQREKNVLELTAKLGSPPDDANPQDHWGGGPFSVRREGFPQVITHDTVIRPEQCGGPLIDTDGLVVGVNIARALRVTTYAVPAETVQKLVESLKKS